MSWSVEVAGDDDGYAGPVKIDPPSRPLGPRRLLAVARHGSRRGWATLVPVRGRAAAADRRYLDKLKKSLTLNLVVTIHN